MRTNVNFVFAVKYYVRHRSRLVDVDNLTEPNNNDNTCYSVLSHQSMCITPGELDNLEIVIGYISSTYHDALLTQEERFYFIAGPEFGHLKGTTSHCAYS